MHKQGEIGSPLCKVLPVEDYIYRGETKTDRYSVRYEWLQSLQSIPEGTQSYSTKFFSMRSVVFLHELHAQWLQLSTMRNIVPLKSPSNSLLLFVFFSSIYYVQELLAQLRLHANTLSMHILDKLTHCTCKWLILGVKTCETHN